MVTKIKTGGGGPVNTKWWNIPAHNKIIAIKKLLIPITFFDFRSSKLLDKNHIKASDKNNRPLISPHPLAASIAYWFL